MTTKTDLPTTRRLAIVKHLAGGKDLDATAALVRLDRSEVLDVASHHGYPSAELLTRAVGLLEAKIERDGALTEHPDADRIARDMQRPTRPPAAPASTPVVAGLTKPDEIRILLNTAKGHESKRIQGQADKVIDAVDRLKAMLREDQEKHAEKRQREAEKVAARAEVDRLTQALADARAKLKGSAPAKPKATRRDDRPRGEHPCSMCGQMFDTPQGRSMHERLHCAQREQAS